MAISDIISQLESSLQNMLALDIVTAVGQVQPTPRDAKGVRQAINLDSGAKILRTRTWGSSC